MLHIHIITILICLYQALSITLTPANYSVTPNYAQSASSLYSFLFNAASPFTANFDVYVYFPTNFIPTSVSNCGFWVNGNSVSTATCSLSIATNQIVFTNLNIATVINNISMQFNTSTSLYAGSSTLIFYFFNTTTNVTISDLTNYISLSIANAVMGCSISSTSNVVGNNVTYNFTYTPLVPIYANSVLQVQMQPWGAYSQSNFLTTNIATICNGACNLSIPSSNGNISQLLSYTSLFPAATSSTGSLILNAARNPPSTNAITISLVLYYKVSLSTQYSYQNCTSTFSVPTPNNFKLTSFYYTNTAISATNIVTLSLQLNNPISSISYLRISPGILRVTYQYNNYNLPGVTPSQSPTSDGTLLLGNLTLAGSSQPNYLVLNNFTMVNPPYANKPVTITFTTLNLVGSTYYQIDIGSVNITAIPSTITSSGISLSNTSINAVSTYTLWFVTVNQLVVSSFIVITFPNTITTTGATCSLSGINSICSITSSSNVMNITLNTLVSGGTNLTITVNSVTNPSTTTPTSSITITAYYQDSQTLVDQLNSGLTVTATSVQLKSVQLTPTSNIVGQLTTYNLTVKITNKLPAGSKMNITIPISSFPSTSVVLSGFYTGATNISGCTLNNVSPMNLQLSASCFPNDVAALTDIKVVLGNIINPQSTKPSDSWEVKTIYNDYLMEYYTTNITTTITTPAQITSLTVIPAVKTVNVQNTYTFSLIFLYPHFSGDRVLITVPSTILINAGFQCLSQSANISVSCIQTSQSVLQVTFTAANSITQLIFTISNILNNWYLEPATFNILTTTNQTTLYYVEKGEANVNFIAANLTSSVASNQLIILLGQSTVSVTIGSPFSLNRALNISQLYLTLIVPSEFTPIPGTCQLSNPSATCSINSQVLNITGFSDLASPIIITFKASTLYFTTSSAFSAQLYYGSALVGINSTATAISFCTSPCKQCTVTPTECLSCLPDPYTANNTYLSVNNTCVAVCPTTFYLSGSQCIQCNSSACYSCTTSANNCTSCQSGKFLYQIQCLPQCPAQYYGLNNSCFQCISPCDTCNSSSICLSCVSEYFLDTNNKCVKVCSNKSYIGLDRICQMCTSNCLTCSGSVSNCTSCEQTQYLLYNNSCVRMCPSGYYNNINSTCKACVSPCTTCSSLTTCQSCVKDYFLYNNNTCTQNCPDGTLGIVNICQPCDNACTTCSITLKNCTSCTSTLYFYQNQCVESCPPLTYPYNKACTTCIQPCVTCSSSPQLCTSCIENMFLMNNTCVDTCPQNGYYTQGNTCLPCVNNCLTCSTLTKCTICQANYFLLGNGCTESCPASHPIVNNRECQACASECETCSGVPGNCTSCAVFYFKYRYTCVKQCPIPYYSNSLTFQCENGLSSRIVFFPVLITSIVVIALVILSKVFSRETALITANAALLTPLEVVIWIYVLSQLFGSFREQGINYTIPIALIILALICFCILSIVFYFVNRRKMSQDQFVLQWASNNVHYYTSQIICLLSVFCGCKFYRIIYSRLFGSNSLSLAYKSRSNVFTVASVFSLCFLAFCEIPVVAGFWTLIYRKILKDQTFYSTIEALIVTFLAILFSLMDIYKSDDFFEETQFYKQKKYVQKVRDYSTMNKLQEGFDISHDQASVDAEKFVSTSGGKFYYTKQKPEDIKDDFYFEENQGDSKTVATDAYDKGKKPVKKINIFGPILEQDGEYYQGQKYDITQTNTQYEIQDINRKLKSFGSDDQEEMTDTIARREQIGNGEVFDDNKSMLEERGIKTKWNNIMDKRMSLAQKIFNKHPPNLAQIDEPSIEDDHQQSTAQIIRHLNEYETFNSNDLGIDSQVNLKRKKKKKRKLNNRQTNKELQAIYLQRLTDKKKSSKNLLSEKSIKYNF